MYETNDSVFFIGNATVLIRYNGFVLLTDPNFLHKGQRAYLGYGLTSRRRTDPAIGIKELPPLDAVVLSHMHGDHWDRVARHGLDKDTPIITTPHAARRLGRQGFRHAVDLKTWGEHELTRPTGSLKITSLPARHAPGAAEALLPPVMGSMLEFAGTDGRTKLRMCISGDTVMDARLNAIPVRFPDIDVGLVHLGGTKLLGMLMVTMDGDQGTRWVNLINPQWIMPIHYDDYTVFSSPLDDFRRHIETTEHASRVKYLHRGDTCPLPVRSST